MDAIQSDIHPTPTVLWSIDLDQSPAGAPWITGDLVLVPTQTGQLYAHSLQDGSLCWQKTLQHAQVGGLASAGQDLVLMATYSTDLLRGEGALVALDAAGTRRWRWSPGVQRISAPAVAGDVVCVTVDAKMLVALDTASGRVRTQLDLEASASPSAPALTKDIAYIPCRGPHLLAVCLDGRSCWHFRSETDPNAWLDKTPVLLGDLLYAVLNSGAVLALHAKDGSLAWRRDVGSTGKPLSPPATDWARLFVGARDGLYALDPTDGARLWHFPTTRRIVAAPVVADGVLHTTCHDHHLYALEAGSGQELWRVELERRIEVAPVVGSELVLAADRGGRLVAVERRLSADRYASKGRWTEAAVAYRLRGEPAVAARLYEERLDQPLLAAELWAEAGDSERAATCYAQAGRYAEAEELYRQAGRTRQAAEMAYTQGAYERAAPLYEQEDAWAEALTCYLALSKQHAAAQFPAPERTHPIRGRVTEKQVLQTRLHDLLVERFTLEGLRQLCFDLDVDYETLSGDEKLAKARALILYLDRRSRLVDLVRVGQEQRPDVAWEEAIQETEDPLDVGSDPTLGGPYAEKIADLSAKLEQWERAGKEWVAVGRFASAAEAFGRAAHRAEGETLLDEARVGDLWAAAEACYDQALDEDRALECHRRVACYRRLPYVELAVRPPERMVRGQYGEIGLELYNAGGGAAYRVVVHHTMSDFVGDLDRTQEMRGLRPGQTLKQSVFVRPTATGPVPLYIAVDYDDHEGRPHQAACHTLIEVVEGDDDSGTDAPTTGQI